MFYWLVFFYFGLGAAPRARLRRCARRRYATGSAVASYLRCFAASVRLTSFAALRIASPPSCLISFLLDTFREPLQKRA
jgi:hypothetical protein